MFQTLADTASNIGESYNQVVMQIQFDIPQIKKVIFNMNEALHSYQQCLDSLKNNEDYSKEFYENETKYFINFSTNFQ
jgi:hypothetical protein